MKNQSLITLGKAGPMQWNGSLLTAASLGVGVVLSPETYAALGRAGGDLGSAVPAAILGAVLLHSVTVHSYSAALRSSPPETAEALLIQQTLGKASVMALFLGARVVPAITLSTAILATAGFVFNEVFVTWFPNFAFAGVILLGILGINLLTDSLAERLQVVLVMTTLLALAVLSLMGLAQASWEKMPTVTSTPSAGARSLLVPLLFLVGFDLARFGFKTEGRSPAPGAAGAMWTALLAATTILGIWTWAVIMAVPGERLAESTVPHMTAARAIAGHGGRILMGLAVVTGTAGALNALLIAVPRNAAGIASAASGRPSALGTPRWRRLMVLILGLCIAGMLVSGMAGEPVLDVWVRAGMLLWLLSYLLTDASALRALLRKAHSIPTSPPNGRPWIWALALVILAASLIMLIISDPARGALMQFMLSTAGVCWLGGWFLSWVRL
jgi:hypothetical protein